MKWKRLYYGTANYTIIHTLISLAAIFTGLVVM